MLITKAYKDGSWAASTSNDWTRIGTMNRERGALLHPDVETATRGAMLRAPTDRFMAGGTVHGELRVPFGPAHGP